MTVLPVSAEESSRQHYNELVPKGEEFGIIGDELRGEDTRGAA